MKKSIFITLIIAIVFNGLAQNFSGGPGDGFAIGEYQETMGIFSGGSNDGFAMGSFEASLSIFSGGSNDGFAMGDYTETLSIFSGGSNDGFASASYEETLSIFSGGSNDGFASASYEETLSIFSGGSNDGFDLSSYQSVLPELFTLEASNIGFESATLNAEVTPNDGVIDVIFRYGIAPDLDQVQVASANPYSGNQPIAIAESISGLLMETDYLFAACMVIGTDTISSDTLAFSTFNNAGYWTGAVDNDWLNAGNWTGGSVPDVNTDVIIPAGCTNYPIMPYDEIRVNSYSQYYDYFCKSLSLHQNAQITGGASLRISGVVNIDGIFTSDAYGSNISVRYNGILNIAETGWVKLGDQNTYGNSNLEIWDGGLVNLNGGKLHIDDRLLLMNNSSLIMNDGELIVNKTGGGSSYQQIVFVAHPGSEFHIYDGTFRVNAKSGSSHSQPTFLNQSTNCSIGPDVNTTFALGNDPASYDFYIETTPLDFGNITVNNSAGFYLYSDMDIAGNLEVFPFSNVIIKSGYDLSVKGNFDSWGSLSPEPNSSISFTGISAQTFQLNEYLTIPTINIDNGEKVKFMGDIEVTDSFNFIYGKVQLYSELTIGPLCAINNPDATRYFENTSTGKLTAYCDASTVIFPMGRNGSYLPNEITNSGVADNISVSVHDEVLENGTSGNAIAQLSDCVQYSWYMEEETAGGSDLTIRTYWNAIDEGADFDRNSCGITHYNSGWQTGTASTAQGSGPYFTEISGITNCSAIAVGDTESGLVTGSTRIELALTIMLEGPFNGTAMNVALTGLDGFPLSQPYNASPWNYTGTELVSSIPNANIVDWVLVETRDAADAASANEASAIERQAAFVLNDGSIVATDGSSNLIFTNVPAQNLFVVIYHRNHLSVMSSVPVTESGGIYNYNFTTALDKAYLNGQKSLNGSVYGMYAGDADADGETGINDIDGYWKLQAGINGYFSGDFNMDTQVDNPDKNDYWTPNQSVVSKVPE